MYFFAFKDFVKDMLAKTTIIYKEKKKNTANSQLSSGKH